MPKQKHANLIEYNNSRRSQERRAKCKVCALSPSVREQITKARALRIPQQVTIAWLRDELGVDVDRRDIEGHGKGQHETRYA